MYILQWTNPTLAGKHAINVPSTASLAPGQGTPGVENNSSLTLTGKGAAGYGQLQQMNLLAVLENFASPTAPLYPTLGQNWYDNANGVLKLCTSISPIVWEDLAGIQVSSGTPPSFPNLGDIWFDRTGALSGALYVYTGLGRFPTTSWDPYVEHAFPAAAAAAAPYAMAKINYQTFTLSNYSEVYIHGFSGATQADVDGQIYVDNAVLATIPRGAVSTSQPGSHFIMWDVGTSTFRAVRHVGLGVWEYDDNTSWVAFTPASNQRLIGTINVGSYDTQNAPGVLAATIWDTAVHVINEGFFVPCATGGTVGIGGWDQVWPPVEFHGARAEYDAMLERLCALIGAPVSFGGNDAARGLDLADLNTADAAMVARWIRNGQDPSVAPPGRPRDIAAEPTSQDWDRLLAATRWAVDRLDLPIGMAQDISDSPFTQDGMGPYPPLQALYSDVRKPSNRRASKRRTGSISSARLYAETMNVLATANSRRYDMKAISGTSGVPGVTTLADTVATQIVGKTTGFYAGGSSSFIYMNLFFDADEQKQRFINGGSAIDLKIDYTLPGSPTANDTAFKAFVDTYNTWRLTADKVRVFGNSLPLTLSAAVIAGGLQAAGAGHVTLATLSSGANSVSVAALTHPGNGVAGTAYLQIRLTVTGVGGLSGATTVLASTVRDASTFGADTAFFPKPLSVEHPATGSSAVWAPSFFTPPPVASFITSQTSGVAPLSVTFTYNGTGSPTMVEWAYGSGTFNNTGNVLTVTLSSSGTYRVSCRATNAGGQDVLSRPTCIVVT
jgi:hypothetical protein